MRGRLVWTAVVVLVASLAAGCTGQPSVSSLRPSPNHSCPSSASAVSEGCWQAVLPLGSGGYPADPGSQNTPLWQPGRFPLTLTPHIAYRGNLWMTAQTRAYSSADGLTWTEHHKTDWGERIYESLVYFKGRLWMLGGLDYQASSFLPGGARPQECEGTPGAFVLLGSSDGFGIKSWLWPARGTKINSSDPPLPAFCNRALIELKPWGRH